MSNIFRELSEIISDRRLNPQENSYTCYLFEKGLDKILKKVGEECAEVIIAAKNNQPAEDGQPSELTSEVCDLIYHLLVLLEQSGHSLESVEKELEVRAEKLGNLKVMKNTDRQT